MLALITYKYMDHFMVDYIISYRRGLLFYYCWMGFARASNLIIDNARAFFMPVHNHSRGVVFTPS